MRQFLVILVMVGIFNGTGCSKPISQQMPKGLPPNAPKIEQAFGFTLGGKLPGREKINSIENGDLTEADDSFKYEPVSGIMAMADKDGIIYRIIGFVDDASLPNFSSALEAKYGSSVYIADGPVGEHLNRWGDTNRMIELHWGGKYTSKIEYQDLQGMQASFNRAEAAQKAKVTKLGTNF
jgi:hypothetical protein